MRGVHTVSGCLIVLRQSRGLLEVLELLVLELRRRRVFPLPQRSAAFSRAADAVDRVHCARIIDVVGGNKRCVQSTRQRRMEQLVDEIGLVLFPEKNPVHPEILRAGIGVEVFPFGIFRIRRRFNRTRPDMAKATGHADAVRTDQILIVIIVGVGVKSFRIPFLLRRFVEIRIRKQAQADDSRRIAVQRSHRQCSCRARRS